MIKEVVLPEISENVTSGEVVTVLVKVGDLIKEEQSIIEIETEKAAFEVPSTAAGKIVEVNVEGGATINVGDIIIKVETDVEATEETAAPPKAEEPKPESKPEKKEEQPRKEPEPEAKEEAPAVEKEPTTAPVAKAAPKRTGGVLASPNVRELARELGVDLNSVPPTGPEGRTTLTDVKNYARNMIAGSSPAGAVTTSRPSQPLPDFAQWGEVERKPLSKIRKIIGDNMSYSWNTVPHVTQYDEADVTDLEKFRKQYAKKVEAAGGKLAVTSIIIKVVAQALKEFPQVNSSLDADRDEIVYKKYCHVGVAVDTDRGLIVPVIRDVDKKSILEVSVELTKLAEKTRNKKITPDEMEGGCFTVSNLGGIGGTSFSPIVYWPQVAILGVSRSVEKPVCQNGLCHPRTILPLSLSYDHRVIDGADGARFLRRIVQILEEPFALALEE